MSRIMIICLAIFGSMLLGFAAYDIFRVHQRHSVLISNDEQELIQLVRQERRLHPDGFLRIQEGAGCWVVTSEVPIQLR